MAYFDNMVAEIFGGRIKEMLAVKKEGKPVVGTFCVYIPEEIVVAAGGVCVGLCGGSQGSVPDAEKVLPRNICPMVKSAYGFKAGRICPYFQTVDFVYGETTCDAKKKTWELLDRLVPTYVMEIPQMKKRRDRTLWLEEVQEFKTKVEEVCKTTISSEDLAGAIRVINDKRRALQRLTRLRASQPGTDQRQGRAAHRTDRLLRRAGALCREGQRALRRTGRSGSQPATGCWSRRCAAGHGLGHAHGPAQLEGAQPGGIGRGGGGQ